MLFFSASVAPNSSFKPTPYLGFVETCGGASNTWSSLPRSARLNSSVSHREKFTNTHSSPSSGALRQRKLCLRILCVLWQGHW